MSNIRSNGVYLIRNSGSNKYLNIYGLDQVGNNRNVCQYALSADLSQQWWVYPVSRGLKLASIIKDNVNKLYTLNVYRNTHKNCDIYEQSTANDPDSCVVFEQSGPSNVYRIRLQNSEKDGSYLYLTSIGSANGSSATTSTSSGNVVWKTSDTSNANQFWRFEFLADYPSGWFDIRKWAAQVFLKTFYQSNIAIDAKASPRLCTELIKALQEEIGIPEPNGTFGPATTENCPTIQAGEYVKPEIIKILCHGLFCKGYNAVTIYDTYATNVQNAVKALQRDAGVAANGIVTPLLFKAILNTDSLVLQGDAKIRETQQSLNALLASTYGVIPTDGKYDRNTNRYLIRALQFYEGLPLEETTGEFLAQTKAHCPTIPYDGVAKKFNNFSYSSDDIAKLTKLFQQALYCNGYDSGNFSTTWTDAIASKVAELQNFVKLPVTRTANMPTWCALLTSRGDDMRPATACDTRHEITDARIETLKRHGIEIVGRYINGTNFKILREGELDRILSSGLGFFATYQDSARNINDFTAEKARNDAQTAINQAMHFRLPQGTVIYFAVDFDAVNEQVTSHIIPYFAEIWNIITYQGKYRVGIYGARNICTRVSNEGYADSSFVSDMSYGFSGNLGYMLPANWNYDQIKNITLEAGTPNELEIDRVVYGEKIPPLEHPFKGDLDDINGRLQSFFDWFRSLNDGRWNLNTLKLGHTFRELELGIVRVRVSAQTKITGGGNAHLANWQIQDGELTATSQSKLNDIISTIATWDIDALKNYDMDNIIKKMGVCIQSGYVSMSCSLDIVRKVLSLSFEASSMPMETLEGTITISLTTTFEIQLDDDLTKRWQEAGILIELDFSWVEVAVAAAAGAGLVLALIAAIMILMTTGNAGPAQQVCQKGIELFA